MPKHSVFRACWIGKFLTSALWVSALIIYHDLLSLIFTKYINDLWGSFFVSN